MSTRKRKTPPNPHPRVSKKGRKTEPPLGGLGLIEYGDVKAKLGLVNISNADIKRALREIGLVPFFPVQLISPDLKKHLFNTKKSFTDIKQGDIEVQIHLQTQIPFSGLMKLLDDNDVTKICWAIRSLMLASFPAELEMAQSSLSCQKEILDREVVGQAIMMLMENSGDPIVYSNETDICTNPGFNFIHGQLDLLFGERTSDSSSHHIVLVSDQKEKIDNVEITETKSASGRLAARRLIRPNGDIKADLSTTIQPILQLLVMGQLKKSDERNYINCFYMNRHKVWPFIYFPSHDVMLTTRRAYVWRTEEKLMMRGCLIIALLLRFHSLSDIPAQLWTDPAIPKTMFLKVSQDSQVNFGDSYVVKSTFEQLNTAKHLDDESKKEVSDIKMGNRDVPAYIKAKHIV